MNRTLAQGRERAAAIVIIYATSVLSVRIRYAVIAFVGWGGAMIDHQAIDKQGFNTEKGCILISSFNIRTPCVVCRKNKHMRVNYVQAESPTDVGNPARIPP